MRNCAPRRSFELVNGRCPISPIGDGVKAEDILEVRGAWAHLCAKMEQASRRWVKPAPAHAQLNLRKGEKHLV